MHYRGVQTEILAFLRCPVCGEGFRPTSQGLVCAKGHGFDQATQGYVNLLTQPAKNLGDSVEMVAARRELLGMGHFDPLVGAVCEVALQKADSAGLLVESGAGTGFYLARVLDSMADRHGLAMDVSKYAARRAARAHARMAAIVADSSMRLPLTDASVALLMVIFAPRNIPEFHRVLRPRGALLIVTPTPDHLRELRAPLGLIEVEKDKEKRLQASLASHFTSALQMPLEWTLELHHHEVALVVGMGPSARHLSAQSLAQKVEALPDPLAVTASVLVQVWRPN